MERSEEYEFYKDPKNQEPAGPPRRRKKPLTEMVPVRFSRDILTEVRRRATADDRTVSAWIRRAVERELEGNAAP